MALSDDLSKLSTRSKEAEDHAAAAHAKSKAALEKEVAAAREDVDAETDKLRKAAGETQRDISNWFGDVHKSMDRQIAAIREEIDEKKAEHDLHEVQKRADRAEDVAAYAVSFAYSAVVEAEYATLNAALARMEADEMAEA